MAYFGVNEHGRWDENLAKAQFHVHVQNIVNKYQEASPEMLKGGGEWYERAHDIASKLTPGDTRRGAGIIAALSPLTSWDKNIHKAHELVQKGTTTHLGPENVVKAQRIHAGEDPETVLGGNKVRSFFGNIHDPSNPEHVTVDRHAYDVATGRPFVGTGGKKDPNWKPGKMGEDLGLSSLGRYKHFVRAYKHAAGELDVDVPHKVQAVTWVTHRGAIN